MTSTWTRLLRRLYVLAVGSVAIAAVAAFIAARSTKPLSPGIVRSALLHLGDVIEDAAARRAEVKRLRTDADLVLAVYDQSGALVVANADPPPQLSGDFPFALAHDPHFGPNGDHFPGPPPPEPPSDERPPDDDGPHGDGPHGDGPHGDDGNHGPRPPPPPRDFHERGDGPHFAPGAPRSPAHGFGEDFEHARAPLAHERFLGGPGAMPVLLTAPSGSRYVAVVEMPGLKDTTKLALLGAGLLLLLGLVSVPFAITLTRPLSEIARATSSFGAGNLAARADLVKSGAFAELAHTFNEMAERVTLLMRQERELRNVSHELRTPLACIRVALDIAAEGDADLARESLADIEDDLAELERLVSDILTAARLENGAAVGSAMVHRASTALRPLIDDAARRFATAHPRHTLRVDASEHLPELELDPVLVRRAIDNFLDNAGKYSEPGSEVILRASSDGDDGDGVEISIEDHGIGIALPDQARLFTPFFRAEKSRARTAGGVGLGLALSRRIIEAHGGTVVIASELGRGTIVTVRLPGRITSSSTPSH